MKIDIYEVLYRQQVDIFNKRLIVQCIPKKTARQKNSYECEGSSLLIIIK